MNKKKVIKPKINRNLNTKQAICQKGRKEKQAIDESK